jgi:multidrug efflux pump subunit AcrA (membrane-fusion protein)
MRVVYRLCRGPLVVLAGFVLVGCSRSPETPAVSVDSAIATARPIVDVRREDGRLQACRVFSFIPSVGNLKLRELHVKEGDVVAEGQALFTFDTAPLIEQITILEMRTNALASKIETARYEADVESPAQAQMELMAAKTVYEEAARAAAVREQMSQSGLASQAELENALRTQERAALAFELAQHSVERIAVGPQHSHIADLEIELKGCEREQSQLQKRLSECIGKAPFAGRILSVNPAIRDFGDDLGDDGLTFARGRGPLLIIADTSKMRIVASFFETAVAFIKPGQIAEVLAEHVPNQTFKGEVVAISQLGYAHGQSSTVSVQVMVDNSKALLKPGLTAEVSIVVARKDDALAIPARFLRYAEEGYYVWQRQGAERVRTPVEIGIADRDFVEILSGIEPHGEVVME